MKNIDNSDFQKGISTNSFINLQNILFYTGIGTCALNIFNELPKEVEISLLGFSSATLLAYSFMKCSNSISKTKDIKQINEAYKEVIKKYNILNKEFNLNNPIQIHTMYSYLVDKGYLSAGKKFEFSNIQARDYKSIMGANIITGKGVCRHISSMLTDILNDYNIEAGTLVTNTENTIINIKTLDEQKYTKEELIDWVKSNTIDEKTRNFLFEVINIFEKENSLKIEFDYKIEEEKDIIKKLAGNHAITYAYQDGNSYYLDPTQNRIYRKENNILTDLEIKVIPKQIFSTIGFDNYKINKNMRNRQKEEYKTISIEEQEELRQDTLNNCKNNMDVFEEFYKDNEDLYEETSNKILTIRKN